MLVPWGFLQRGDVMALNELLNRPFLGPPFFRQVVEKSLHVEGGSFYLRDPLRQHEPVVVVKGTAVLPTP